MTRPCASLYLMECIYKNVFMEWNQIDTQTNLMRPYRRKNAHGGGSISKVEDPQQPNYSGVTPGQCVVPVCRVISSWAQNVTDGDPSLMQQSLQHPKQREMRRGDQTNEKRERSSLCIKGRN
ncbi:hypothetical protein DPX16_13718 [Anabarilius grahami]|uniref:Uncharacterized protein n=1 Tax=Anabarilius grahami TaxID=495550 RepID=A0A3N0XRT3_ANAGA|nr:hypothetical protein DPX16_13718 [Anabarilius grahami]